MIAFSAISFRAIFVFCKVIDTMPLSLFRCTQAEKVGNPKKKMLKLYKSRQTQILSHEIEPNPSKDRAMHEGDNLRFEMNL
jgi:hypothetical protein